ncbi:uncharacterized protein LOC135489877 [Lineus longissimus]|uniref:uncharacterized protein LOC135489877 n=1 Tax=Lineus longissimus TaxID=88925 RepID=UPI002B4E0607
MIRILFASLLAVVSHGDLDARLGVAWDKTTATLQTAKFAFSVSNGKVQCSDWTVGKDWSTWTDVANPTGVLPVSNPSLVHDHKNATLVFIQGNDGQVYFKEQIKSSCSGFSAWNRVSPKTQLPFNKTALAHIIGKDSVTALRSHQDNTQIYVFARSYASPSQFFYTVFDGVNFTPWYNLGGSLLSDFSVVGNPYSLWFEAFSVQTDGYVHHIWQHKGTIWSSWSSSFGSGQPAVVPTTRPVSHAMSGSFFNGRLEVFALGKDGLLHHIWQTTCDAVPNLWGYCTWWIWSKIDKQVPAPLSSINGFSIGTNVHLGNEAFVFAKDYSVHHIYQLDRGDNWSDWASIGRPPSSVGSLPKVTEYVAGWWAVNFATSSKVITMTQNRTIRPSVASFPYKTNTTVQWDAPVDEATHKDWIGVYPAGVDNERYIDFRYVQGGQNPLKDPVPKGNVTFNLFLPKGYYDVRYLVNKQFVDVMSTGISSTSSSKDPEWIQVFQGLVTGMGKEGLNITGCVKDGEATVETIEKAVDAFENRDIYKGLQLIGQALKDLYDAYMACGETDIANKLIAFVNDLISCTEGSCMKFVIDLAKEILVLYEDIYEIFGDIKAAVNSIKILKAYEQGCVCIGRVVAACISLPRVQYLETEAPPVKVHDGKLSWWNAFGSVTEHERL